MLSTSALSFSPAAAEAAAAAAAMIAVVLISTSSSTFGHRAVNAVIALGLAGPFQAVAAAPERGGPISVAHKRST